MAEVALAAIENVAEKENVLIRAGNCTLTLLPQRGGKIASLRVNGSRAAAIAIHPVLRPDASTSWPMVVEIDSHSDVTLSDVTLSDVN